MHNDKSDEIAAAGLNTVRVPVGFWILGYDNHDPANLREWEVYTKGTIVYLDQLIQRWAKKHNVAVLVSLHAAKGSQNGADHSSPTSPGHTFWSQYSENVANTIEVARFLAKRYLNEEAFLGIGLLNEPNGSTDEKVLYQFYKDAYRAVRAIGSDCVLSIMPMLQKQNPDEMVDFMTMPEFLNIWVEWHPYFVWGWNATKKNNRLFIGEWSLATPSNMRCNNPDFFYKFASEQLKVHDQAEAGWTFWSWKVTGDGNSDVGAWSLQELLKDDQIAKMFRNSS
ncbi:unnamed protein product [Peronospora belbahrii]|uniref:glucan 1,3-beta-glucosidase n=1 Tax=Peronospora belbahrii TaxID=622444 RepID=A0AAU9KNS1_9STRA|nr:unnamed protein product [Peronospora belbahrii]